MSDQAKDTVMPLVGGWRVGNAQIRQQASDWAVYVQHTEALRQQARRLAKALTDAHNNVCGCKLEGDITLCDAQEVRLAIAVYKEATG